MPDFGPAAVIAPAGARGPTFVVFQNFYVIKRYNNATSHAMGRRASGGQDRRRGISVRRAARRARAVALEKIDLQERLIASATIPARPTGDRPRHDAGDPQLPGRAGLTPDGYAWPGCCSGCAERWRRPAQGHHRPHARAPDLHRDARETPDGTEAADIEHLMEPFRPAIDRRSRRRRAIIMPRR